jgi:hypothetical protein
MPLTTLSPLPFPSLSSCFDSLKVQVDVPDQAPGGAGYVVDKSSAVKAVREYADFLC